MNENKIERNFIMFRILKKSLILLLLLTINTIVYIVKIIHEFYEKNNSNIKKYAKSFHSILKEELER